MEAARAQPALVSGETLIMGIGQGYFLATPLQLAAATAAIANNGTFYARVVDYLSRARPARSRRSRPAQHADRWCCEQNWEDVRQGMLHVVEARGTAKAASAASVTDRRQDRHGAGVHGRQDEDTTRTELDKKLRDHALFIAYAPAEDPQIAVAVVVETAAMAARWRRRSRVRSWTPTCCPTIRRGDKS